MKNLLFPGWASFRKFYEKELIEEFIYDDFSYENNEEINVIAWSMGTLKALEYIKNHKINKLILLAPTSNFTKTTSRELVDNMIEGIKTNKIETLNNFYRLNFSKNSDYANFIEEYKSEIENLIEAELIEGLEFLRDKTVIDYSFENVKEIYVITGKRDKVINSDNTKEFISTGKHIEFNMGHNFIYGNKVLYDLVRSILSD